MIRNILLGIGSNVIVRCLSAKMCTPNQEPDPTSVRPVFRILAAIVSILFIWGSIGILGLIPGAIDVNYFYVWWHWLILVIFIVMTVVVTGMFIRAALIGKGPRWLIRE